MPSSHGASGGGRSGPFFLRSEGNICKSSFSKYGEAYRRELNHMKSEKAAAGAFNDAFRRYLDKAEPSGVRTTGMGSMFRLSCKIRMKDPAEEKAFIDELRTRNGNLEIFILPWTEQTNQL